MKMRSVMSHAFSMVPSAEIPRSSFDRSHGVKTAFDAGKLIPVFVDEVLPGDTFNLNMTAFARLATPVFPIMDNMFMDSFFFFVPYRLLWDNWQKFMGERYPTTTSSIDFTIPLVTPTAGTGFLTNTNADWFGVPVGVDGIEVSALPFRALLLIWNEWFRDQNLSNATAVPMDDGPDTDVETGAGLGPFPRAKKHDYFTSALPWPQKGDSVLLPLGSTAPVVPENPAATSPSWFMLNAGAPAGDLGGTVGYTDDRLGVGVNITASDVVRIAGAPGDLNTSGMVADLSAATSATINQLRQAFQVQRLLERDARGGSRYTEIIRSHFGVVSPDQRLQRPEYLGGGSSPVNIVAVPQTSETDAGTPQGNLAGYGSVTLRNHSFSKSFTEHGVVIGLVTVRADLTYQQGLERMWSRQTRYDFYWPALSHIGEQSILSKEIFCDGTADDEDVFGYQERYAEYRYKPSKITGLMRSNLTAGFTTLDSWHLSEDFASRPLLNHAFITAVPPVDRVIAVATEPHFIFDGHFSLRCARPMPMYGVPGMIDHF